MSQSLAEGLQGGVNIGWPNCRTVVPMTPGAHETMSTRIQQLRAFAATRATHTRSFRMDQLKALRELFEDYATDIQDALWQDIGKSAAQTDQTEFAPVKDEIAYAILHLTEWMEPESRSIPIALRPARARVRARPLGTVGIIGHWVQPFRSEEHTSELQSRGQLVCAL